MKVRMRGDLAQQGLSIPVTALLSDGDTDNLTMKAWEFDSVESYLSDGLGNAADCSEH
jgi:hypothetical protein